MWSSLRSSEERWLELASDAVIAFAKALRPDDDVVLKATGNTAAVVRLVRPHVGRVTIANPVQLRAIAYARVKTDKIDAAMLTRIQASGFLPEVWIADETTLEGRRLASERAALLRQILRVKSPCPSDFARQSDATIRRALVRQGWVQMARPVAPAGNRARHAAPTGPAVRAVPHRYGEFEQRLAAGRINDPRAPPDDDRRDQFDRCHIGSCSHR